MKVANYCDENVQRSLRNAQWLNFWSTENITVTDIPQLKKLKSYIRYQDCLQKFTVKPWVIRFRQCEPDCANIANEFHAGKSLG